MPQAWRPWPYTNHTANLVMHQCAQAPGPTNHTAELLVGVVCLLRRSVGLEYGLVSLGLHCFLRLERALC